MTPIECKCKEDFKGYLLQFCSKCYRLQGGQEFSKYFETHIATDMVSLAGIRREAGLGGYFFYFNSVKSTHSKLASSSKKKTKKSIVFITQVLKNLFRMLRIIAFHKIVLSKIKVNCLRDVNFCV